MDGRRPLEVAMVSVARDTQADLDLRLPERPRRQTASNPPNSARMETVMTYRGFSIGPNKPGVDRAQFESRIQKTSDGWLWAGTVATRGGYGEYNHRGAHVVAWECYVG